MRIEGGAPRRRPGIDDLLPGGQEIVPGLRRRIGHARLVGDARMPAGPDHVEQERPAVELAVDRVLRTDRGDDVVEHILRDVVVPRLDDIGLDHRRHLHERRLADIDVPGALAVLRLGDEALDAEALDRRDLVVDAGELGVHGRDAGMKILDPLIERRGQRPVLRKGRSDAGLRRRGDARHAETGDQAPGTEIRDGRSHRAAAARREACCRTYSSSLRSSSIPSEGRYQSSIIQYDAENRSNRGSRPRAFVRRRRKRGCAAESSCRGARLRAASAPRFRKPADASWFGASPRGSPRLFGARRRR